MNKKQKLLSCVVCLGFLQCANYASASAVFTSNAIVNPFAGTSILQSTASFTIAGDVLTVVLSNIGGDVERPSDVLTGVWFSHVGLPPGVLTPVSAVLTAGSSVLFGGTDPGGVVGGEWAYGPPVVGGAPSGNQGISSSGLGLVGGASFPGTNLQGPAGVDGVQYGITSAADNPGTGNAAVTGSNALIQSSVTFTFSGATGLLESGFGEVSFQYGTALNEPNLPGNPFPPGPAIPEPASFVIWGLTLLCGTAVGFRGRFQPTK